MEICCTQLATMHTTFTSTHAEGLQLHDCKLRSSSDNILASSFYTINSTVEAPTVIPRDIFVGMISTIILNLERYKWVCQSDKLQATIQNEILAPPGHWYEICRWTGSHVLLRFTDGFCLQWASWLAFAYAYLLDTNFGKRAFLSLLKNLPT